jgi:HK97 family phage major capsid protein
MTLKEMREAQEKLLADARAKLDEITDDTDESRAAEIESEYDAIMASYDDHEKKAQREEDIAKRKATLAEREAALEEIDRSKRPGGGSQRAKEDGDEPASVTERSAFNTFLRYGPEGLSSEERDVITKRRNEVRRILGDKEARAQGVATAGAGGALVPEDYMAEIVKSLAAWGPMNDDTIVRVIETSGGADMPWPTVNDTSNEGVLIGENTADTEQDVTFSSKTLQAFKYSSRLVKVSSELLQDAAFNVEEELRGLFAERIGRIYNRHFTVGTGSSQPNGIVTASTAGVTAASATTLTADELIDLEHSVDPAYRSDPSCRFQFNDTTFKVIRKLKDGDNNYLWQPADLRIGAPASFLGYPYSVNQAMDSFGDSSPAEDNRPVIFGAHSRYVVRRVRALVVRRLDERYAEADQVGFIGFTRADGELLDTAAVKHLRAAT